MSFIARVSPCREKGSEKENAKENAKGRNIITGGTYEAKLV